MRKKYKAAIGMAALLLIGALFVTHQQILLAIGNFLIVKDDLAPADVIHVIAGADYRTDHAITLYKQCYAKLIFFTGGWCTLHNEYLGKRAKRRAAEQGIPLEAIAIDDSEVTSTYSEAARMKEFIDRSRVSIKSVMVVSDPYHMRRSRWSYKMVLGDAIKLEMAPVPFALLPYNQIWWTDPEGRNYVKNEYLKILYYYARYKFSWGKFKEWLASLDKN